MTTRRLFLGALPVAALTLSACSTNRTAKEVIDSVGPPPRPASPDDAIQALVDGNARFATNSPQVRNTADIELLWTSGIDQKQEPFASVLGCADSRLAPEIIFDQFVGDIFVVREAGNIAATRTAERSMPRTRMRNQAATSSRSSTPSSPPSLALPVSRTPSRVTCARSKTKSARTAAMLREAEQSNDFAIVGAYYDIATAVVRFL